eukprot:2349842-Prymnesium_polylepis.1
MTSASPARPSAPSRRSSTCAPTLLSRSPPPSTSRRGESAPPSASCRPQHGRLAVGAVAPELLG